MPGSLNKIALIIGANKGIGFEVARQLGKAGCTVLLGHETPILVGKLLRASKSTISTFASSR
jgi:NAD(P)-dependent dehydrogenase (short-subunit alcohol dehydrogenase family)